MNVREDSPSQDLVDNSFDAATLASMQIGIDAVGVFEGDRPENVVIMQIGVSRFHGRTGALARVGYVVPRGVRGMRKMLALASGYLASASDICAATWEVRGQPRAPLSVVASKVAVLARLVIQLAIVVVSVPVQALTWGARFAKVSWTMLCGLRANWRREVSEQPGTVLFALSATAVAAWVLG